MKTLLVHFSRVSRGAWRDHCFPERFPWFLHETGLESLNTEDHLCTLFFIEMSGKTRKKRRNTASFGASLGAGVQPRSTILLYNFSCLSAVSKNGRLRTFFSALVCLCRGKAFRDQQSMSNNKMRGNLVCGDASNMIVEDSFVCRNLNRKSWCLNRLAFDIRKRFYEEQITITYDR